MPAFSILRPHLPRKKDSKRDSSGSNTFSGIRAASARLRKAASLHSSTSSAKKSKQNDNPPLSHSVDMQRLKSTHPSTKDDRCRSADRASGGKEKGPMPSFGLFKSRHEGSHARLSAGKDQSFTKLKRDTSFGRLSLRRTPSRDRFSASSVPSKTSSARDIREFARSASSHHKSRNTPVKSTSSFDVRLEDSTSEPPISFGPASLGVRSDSTPRSFGSRSEGPRSLPTTKSAKVREYGTRPLPPPLPKKCNHESKSIQDVQLVPVLRRLAPVSDLCEHCRIEWKPKRRAWMSVSGEFHIVDGDEESKEGTTTRVLRYEKFRAELGFCAAFWVIARPGRSLDLQSARRLGLLGPTLEPLGGFVIRLFLADRNEHGFVAGMYYASADVGARGGYKPIALHALSLESLRVVLTWARHVKDSSRAPKFPEASVLTAPVAQDIIDTFCTSHPGTVLGPPSRNPV